MVKNPKIAKLQSDASLLLSICHKSNGQLLMEHNERTMMGHNINAIPV